MNAIPVLQAPTLCRVVACDVGGYAEARGAIEAAGVDLLFARTRAGVLAFGADSDVHAAFDSFNITKFDLHTIETKRLRFDSGERGLLQDALSKAVSRHRGLKFISKGSSDLLHPADASLPTWAPLKRHVGALSGAVPGLPALHWFEGLEIRLEWANDRLWLLLEPRTIFDGITPENKGAAADFARERTVKRYNRNLNDLIDFWAKTIAGSGESLRACNSTAGVEAVFRLGSDTAYSRKS
jgi:hypothetical protein